METIKLTELQFHLEYARSARKPNHPKVSGPLDATPFDRMELYEIHHLINTYAEMRNLRTKAAALKLETMLQDLPEYCHTQADAVEWLDENWEGWA